MSRRRVQVDVDFGAGSAGAGVAHFPEVVLFAEVVDVVVGLEADCSLAIGGPDVGGFLVVFVGVAGCRFVAGDVEARWGFPDFGEEFPGHFDGALFEVVAEGPVAEHFEEGVVEAGRPTSSRSLCLPPARMHFWVLAARGPWGVWRAEEDRA